MFPLLDEAAPNPLELFQIWLNLPAADKLTDPYFTMLWDRDVPRVTAPGAEISVIAGRLGDVDAPPPPPSSWASRPESDLAIWLIRLDVGASWELPAATGPHTLRTLYCFEGDGMDVDGTAVGAATAALVDPHRAATLTAGATEVQCLLLQGRPIGEPVERYGPFVMNTREELEQAFADYRATEFGGWPWPTDDPVQAREQGRFARHADGRIETVD
jgi:redox-sensitive bicupin YhaK (pirin superfamily)